MTSEQAAPLRRAVSYTARLAQQPRLLLAAKTSLAAVLAWYLAPLIPFLDDQYSYYAPLGALVTMYPTVARSARVGFQVLIGLALGIALGLCGIAGLHLGVPVGAVLGTVIGVGVLFGGLRRLGAGGDWVPLAALFVLLIGGATDPEEFSISYLGTTAFGVLVGIAVNLIVVPPLYLRRASDRLTALRETVTGLLDDAADAVAADDVEPERFERRLETLAETREAVSADVEEAEDSARANPRQVRHRGQREENNRRMRALDRSALAGATYLLQNLLLLPGLLPIEPLITVAWSLSYEMFYYLVVPLLIGALRLRARSRPWRCIFFGALAVAVAALGATLFGSHVRLIMFVAGILLHEALAGGRAPVRRAPGGLVALAALAAGLLCTLLPITGASGYALKVSLLFVSFFVLCLACFARPESWLPRAFSWTPLRWLGNMSYSYYLVHGLALKAAFVVLAAALPASEHGPLFFWTLMALMFALTLVPSTLLFLLVERPFSLAPKRKQDVAVQAVSGSSPAAGLLPATHPARKVE
jgi:peptidoglycan/LPS O-acetylase OafA/YrhL